MPNPSGFASAIINNIHGVYPTLNLPASSVTRAIDIANAVTNRSAGMMLTADEALIVSRTLLRVLEHIRVVR